MATSGPGRPPSCQIKVLTFNCWGLKHVSKHRVERIHAIADFLATAGTPESPGHSPTSSIASAEGLTDARLALGGAGAPSGPGAGRKPLGGQGTGRGRKEGPYDVVALQEIWVYKDFLVISERAKTNGLVYSKYFHSATLGAGIALLSRFPIRSSNFLAYSLNGHPTHFIEGDFFVGKAVGSCLLDVPSVGPVEVFTTHLYAPHDHPAPEWKRAHRTAQAWELSKLVLSAVQRGRHAIVCGDLNSVPSSLPIQLLLSHSGLRDAWVCHPGPRTAPASSSSTNGAAPGLAAREAMQYLDAIREDGFTCDSMVNTFTAGKNPADRGTKGYGKRLDYTLFRPRARRRPAGEDVERDEWEDDGTIEVDDCHVTLTEPVPILGFSYSDHFALETTVTISPTRPAPSSQTLLSQQRRQDAQNLSSAIVALATFDRHAASLSRFHLSIFVLCLFLVPGVAVAASFQPLSFLNWIFTLLSVAIGALGATMLYVGFVGGRWERNAIRELSEEMEVAREAIVRDEQKYSR